MLPFARDLDPEGFLLFLQQIEVLIVPWILSDQSPFLQYGDDVGQIVLLRE